MMHFRNNCRVNYKKPKKKSKKKKQINKPTFTSAVKAAAARKRPFGDRVAMWFLSWFVSTVANSFPLFPCQILMSVPAWKMRNNC